MYINLEKKTLIEKKNNLPKFDHSLPKINSKLVKCISENLEKRFLIKLLDSERESNLNKIIACF